MGYRYPERKRALVRKYIREHPGCTRDEIRDTTKVKIERVYDCLLQAYLDAGVEPPERLLYRDREQQRRDVIEYIQKHPESRVTEIQDETGVCVPRVFGSIVEAFIAAGVQYTPPPRNTGVMNRSVILEADLFEADMLELLRRFGTVWEQVRCDAGVADGVLEFRGECFVVEVKHYTSYGNVTKSDIKQLSAYMDALECRNGLLICPDESVPKRVNPRDIVKNRRRILIRTPNDFGGVASAWQSGRLQIPGALRSFTD